MNVFGFLRSIIGAIWQNKWRIVLSLLCAVVFSVLFFPFDDLTDLISSQVALATNNSINVQFERLRLSFFPQLGVQVDQVEVASAMFPALKAGEITVTPSLRAALSQKPFGHIAAKEIFGGDVDIRLGSAGTSDRGVDLQRLEISADKLNLSDLRKFGQIPALLKGQLSFETAGTIDITMAEQPEMDVSIKINHLEMPQSNLPLGDMGDVTLPDLKISGVDVKGKLSSGHLTIESIKIGNSAADDLFGTIKGSMDLALRPGPAGPYPELGAYSFDVDLQPSADFRERAKFFLGLLASYQQGTKIRMKVTGTRFGAPPNMSPLR